MILYSLKERVSMMDKFPHSAHSGKQCIYMLINQDNGKIYIGKSQNPAYRTHQHFQLLRRNKHPNKSMQNDFNNREKNFCWAVLQTGIEPRESSFVEQDWMVLFKSFDSQNGYNDRDTYFYRRGKLIGRAKRRNKQ